MALRKTDRGWKFIDESELETFVWDNLEEIFELKPLTRQLSIKGEICDILATGENNQLAIIELKNIEDRYVINQLTRYYDNLLEEQPLKTNINYDKEIRLLAICPSFHRHNLIDEKHSKLSFSLFTFFLVYENNEFYFHLSQIHNQSETKIIKIKYQEVNLQNQENDNIPEPPRLLLDWLGSLTNTEIENLTAIRHQILSFDHRIEEIIVNKSILYATKYGKDKMRVCAEFCYARKSKKMLLFLWLIIPSRQNKTIARMQIDPTEEYLTYRRYAPVKEGSIFWEKFFNHIYYTVPENKGSFLKQGIFVDDIKSLVDKALQIWLERIN
ncbi:endonuclease NucS domain-containing protein [Nostoc sp.]|uniref:endonuclease NucS domain-containing protein n=1 Tax=Nostoc sp. TaxID=1180 RepID=UPI002FF71F8B